MLEIILNDGAKVAEVEEAVLALRSSLGTQGIGLNMIVAAEWSLESIEYTGVCRSESGIRSAESFRAGLVAGSARQSVIVEVSFAAREEFEARIGAEKPEKFEQVNVLVCEILRDQVNDWLSQGGESRWNPVTNNVVQLSHLPLQKRTA